MRDDEEENVEEQLIDEDLVILCAKFQILWEMNDEL